MIKGKDPWRYICDCGSHDLTLKRRRNGYSRINSIITKVRCGNCRSYIDEVYDKKEGTSVPIKSL